MRDVILNALKELSCDKTSDCQINLQSESTQVMIAEKILEKLNPHVNELIEDIVLGASTNE